eukprot:s2039_g1.t1
MGDPVDIWQMPVQELAVRLGEAWQYRISCELSVRKTFAGLHLTNPKLTMESMTTQPRDRAILRSALNGTFFTANHLKHRAEPTDTSCKFCGQPDSLHHRNWTCAALEPCRKHLSQETKQTLLDMPPATHLQGWIPQPVELLPFRRMLDEVPSYQTMILAPLPPNMHGPLHFLTDGTCLRPQDRFARLCAWGVVVSDPEDMWTFRPVAAGPLQGRHQTVLRAELVAAMPAIAAAIQSHAMFCLWSDNSRVVQLLQQMLADPERTWNPKVCNHDLITELAVLLHQAGSLCQGVFKVTSHQQCFRSTPAAERWCFAGNEAADAFAANVLTQHPQLMHSWSVLCKQLDTLRALRDDLHTMLLNIGIECLLKNPNTYFRQTQHARLNVAPLVMTDWRFPDELPPAAEPYKIPELQDMFSWIHSLHDDTQPVQRWSWWQLYVDATPHVPAFGPWYHTSAKRWKGGNVQPPEPFLRKARWLAQFLTKLAKACSLKLPTEHTSAAGSIISLSTLPVRVPLSRTEEIDSWLRTFLPQAVARMGVFKLPNINTRVISVRGTSQAEDWLFNADVWAPSVLTGFDGYGLVLTGHSLGGGMAQLCGSIEGIRTLTFSPVGQAVAQARVNGDSAKTPGSDGALAMVSLLSRGIACTAINPVACHSLLQTACELYRKCGDPRNRSIDFACKFQVGNDWTTIPWTRFAWHG